MASTTPTGSGPIVVPRFVVIGGAADGHFYVRQLLRAVAAGRLATERIFVVDRDPQCAAARDRDPRVRLEVAEWSAWLDARLEGLSADDQVVPYHWAPHLLLDWLERQARRSGARTGRGGEAPSVGVPFERTTRDGGRALSYATWICPLTCIEPALCPHTRGPKNWSLAADLAALEAPERGLEALVFPSFHLVYGVAAIPVASILAARARVLAALRHGPRRYVVATSSHCHALASVLDVAPAAS